MNARMVCGTHLGERRFLEYPRIDTDDWCSPQTARFTPARLVGAAMLLVIMAAGVLLALR